MKPNSDRKWNPDVERQVKSLLPVKKWLARCVDNKDTDWETQKSAHQALRLLEMAEFEMWNMQWFKDKTEQVLYRKAEDKVRGR